VVAAGMVGPDRRATAISICSPGSPWRTWWGVPAVHDLLSRIDARWRVDVGVLAAIWRMRAGGDPRFLVPQPAQAAARSGAVAGNLPPSARRLEVWLAAGVERWLRGAFSSPPNHYREPMMTNVADYSRAQKRSTAFRALRLGMTVGNQVGGRLSDRASCRA